MLARQPMTVTRALQEFSKAPPVDVYGLADALGLRVIESNFPDSISGKIERKSSFFDDYSHTITLNANHPKTRQRFTLAHEIAHFVLHQDQIGDGIVDDGLYRSNKSDEIEREANGFAATILMPGTLVQQAFRSGTKSISGIAKLFDVSYAVAEIRMKELRLG